MKQLRCALYPRVSTEEQFLHGLSLDAQRKDLTEYAQRMGYKIVGVYADEGVSARKPVSKRPALLQLLADVEKDKIDIILVTKLDRWFRNIKEYQITQEILDRHHCYWKTIFEQYDTSTANGQMVVNIMLAVNQSECDRTSERIKVVLDHKFKNGEHVTGAAPYGYVLVDKKLEKDPAVRHVVEDAVDYYFSCFSKRKTVMYIMSKYADFDRCPSKYQVNRILTEELYAGIYRGITDYHPAYITRDQLNLIKETADTKTYPHTNRPYIFSGLMKCPHCGKIMSGFCKKQILKNGGVSYYQRYRCSSKLSKCPSPCITESVIEKYMLDHLCSGIDEIICNLSKKEVQHVNRIPALKSELQRLNILYQKGRISDEYYDEQYALLESEIEKESQNEDAEVFMQRMEELKKEFSGNWKELYDMLDAQHKNAFWKRIVSEITIDENTHKINGFKFLK